MPARSRHLRIRYDAKKKDRVLDNYLDYQGIHLAKQRRPTASSSFRKPSARATTYP